MVGLAYTAGQGTCGLQTGTCDAIGAHSGTGDLQGNLGNAVVRLEHTAGQGTCRRSCGAIRARSGTGDLWTEM